MRRNVWTWTWSRRKWITQPAIELVAIRNRDGVVFHWQIHVLIILPTCAPKSMDWSLGINGTGIIVPEDYNAIGTSGLWSDLQNPLPSSRSNISCRNVKISWVWPLLAFEARGCLHYVLSVTPWLLLLQQARVGSQWDTRKRTTKTRSPGMLQTGLQFPWLMARPSERNHSNRNSSARLILTPSKDS